MRLAELSQLVLSTGARVASGVTTDASLAADHTFDYIVVGGGLAGMTVASRLSEDENLSVLVIEAGRDDRTNPLVYDLYQYGQVWGSDLLWRWSTDQGRVIYGGQTLGGSSSIHGATWTTGSAAQYDAWTSLLEPSEADLGWNWANLSSYIRQAETFTPPSDDQRANGADYTEKYHGTSGPVPVAFPAGMFGGPHQKYFQQTVSNLTGIALSPDGSGGDPNSVSITPSSIDPNDSDHRASSASSYLTPVEGKRDNWLVLATHLVTEVLFDGTDIPVTATGVKFRKTDKTGDTFTAYARREVILAAGAIKTPVLLQQSGIGDPAHLASVGVDCIVNITTVGRNLQEQTMSQIGADGNGEKPTGKGPNNVIAYPSLDQLFGDKADDARHRITSSIKTWADSQANNGLSSDALQTIMQTQADYILNHNGKDVSVLVWTLLPFSRGAVKITSTDPFVNPNVTVNFFSVDFDMQMQIESARLARRILSSLPLSSLTTQETEPGNDVPGGNDATDAAWEGWIRWKFNTVSHPIGTAAMMRRSLGGVVDGKLRVYDTTNLRVVDASIMPLQVSAHLQSTLYGVGEKAAALIKADVK
ncbi:glucose oxidase [Auricularia subglabra TFB-10046 SS5]|nr:glucose oxidase [Auricularia subglabra TFB-10046 SS5]